MTLSIPMVRVPMKKFPFVALMAALLFAGLGWPQRHAFCASGAPISKVLALPNASLLMEEDGHMLISRHADRPMVPASTMKILTALASIQRWGMGHRFHTDFHMTGDGRLWVKGEGDPYLVSEELDRIVATLKRKGIRSVNGLGLDSCYAGFVKRQGSWQPFSLLINQPVPHGLRKQVADALARTPNLAIY